MAKRSGSFAVLEKDIKQTSCNIVLAFSDILSNSSIQQIPLSLKTSAPLSRTCNITTSIWEKTYIRTQKCKTKRTKRFNSVLLFPLFQDLCWHKLSIQQQSYPFHWCKYHEGIACVYIEAIGTCWFQDHQQEGCLYHHGSWHQKATSTHSHQRATFWKSIIKCQ